MWPMFVDYSEEKCKAALRDLELVAYSSVINAFRAQGILTKERKKILQDLGPLLSISMERHRMEMRRVINDEHFSTIAERLSGSDTVTDWQIEGRRVVSLMQRLAPQTAFSETANSAASCQAFRNSDLPFPERTGLNEGDGLITMASRKRKNCPIDPLEESPHKLAAMDTNFLHHFLPLDKTIPMPSALPDDIMVCESSHSSDVSLPVSSFTEFNASRNITTSFTSSSKTVALKTTPLSSFDQLTSNLLASRAASQTHVPAVLHDEQASTLCDATKPSTDMQSAQRPSSMKSSPNIVIPTPSSASASSSPTPKDRLQTHPCASQSNKFLTQIRTKNTGHTRQNLPAGLGIKLTPQSQVNQRTTVSPKSPIKTTKQDNSPSIFSKKSSSTILSSSSSSDKSLSNDSISVIPKSPVMKTTQSKTECQPSLNAKPQQTSVKTLPKTTQPNTPYVSRSLFSTSTNKTVGPATKSLSPVIFNVTSPTCTTLQTAPKMTGASQSEAGKLTTMTTQMVPKTSPVAISTSHVKINTSNAQTIQYRNDGGIVRSARIVNISQPVGSRLPCAISPSAISALGLSANLSSTALRVTLPAGTLNPSSSIRVSTAAKPNVIVVHKANMWPRSQQGGAVIMTSASLPKVTNDIAQETLTITNKQDKNKPPVSKISSRTISTVRPQSPVICVSTEKVAEPKAIYKPAITSTTGSTSEQPTDERCRKNILADIMTASGILLENTARQKAALLKEKNNTVKNNIELSNHQEVEIISQKGQSSSTSEATSTRLSEANVSKAESANNSSGNTALTVERNGVDIKKQGSAQAQSVESKDTSNTVVTSHITSESVTSSSECVFKGQAEITKDNDS